MASNLKCYAFSNGLRIDEGLDPVNKIILEVNLKRSGSKIKLKFQTFWQEICTTIHFATLLYIFGFRN